MIFTKSKIRLCLSVRVFETQLKGSCVEVHNLLASFEKYNNNKMPQSQSLLRGVKARIWNFGIKVDSCSYFSL
jgi:hypothetical protein